MEKQLKLAGYLDQAAVEKVLADVRAHQGGYDALEVRLFEDGTGELRSTFGASAPISFQEG